jgi:hypothetical protein
VETLDGRSNGSITCSHIDVERSREEKADIPWFRLGVREHVLVRMPFFFAGVRQCSRAGK